MRAIPRHVVPVIIYAILSILVIPVFPHYVSPNEFSRWDLAVALIDFHTVDVTQAVAATHTKTEDLSSAGGRLYSNKAPGAALAGLPGYAIARPVAGPPSAHNMRATLTAMRMFAATLPAILLALLLGTLATRLGLNATFAVVAMLFGTPLFAYGLLFFAHSLTAFALFASFAFLFAERRELTAGSFMGIAVLSEYPAAIPCAILIACALPRLRLRGLLRLLAGGLPFAIVLAMYDFAAFGNVFSLGSAHESAAFYRQVAQQGWFGVSFPSPAILFQLLFDPSKGLFVFSPVLLLAFLGIRRAHASLPRAEFVALVATPLSIVLTFSGYANWDGGWTVGARYLVPSLPFFALLIAFARPRLLDAFLLGASVAAIAIVSLVFPFVGRGNPAPWISFSWPILRDGYVAPNLLHFVSRPLAIAVPFVLVAAAAFVAVPRTRAPGLVLGGAIWFLAGLPFAESAPRNVRAVVEAVHFQDGRAIARVAAGDARTRAALEAIARDQRRAPPDFWPF